MSLGEREQTTIRLPVGMKEELQREAVKRGVGLNSLMLLIIKGFLESQS